MIDFDGEAVNLDYDLERLWQMGCQLVGWQ